MNLIVLGELTQLSNTGKSRRNLHKSLG